MTLVAVAALIVVFDFAGYVALLLWGVHMVQSGVQRAFGAHLNTFLGRALDTRIKAFFVGLGITAAIQSSTAVGLMITSFASGGIVALVPALAAMLGANVGTTLIVQVLSFNLTALSPILILVGVWLFRRSPPGTPRDLGRVFIGLGLLLMSLHQLVGLFAPMKDAPLAMAVLQALDSQPVAAVLVAAVLTWAAHSSVAMVVLVMSLASLGLVAPDTAFALVLGANLGTAVNPLVEGVNGEDPASRRLPLGNFLTRVGGVLAALMLLPWLQPWVLAWSGEASRAIANFHTLFNLAIAAAFLPLLGPYSRLLTRWLPQRIDPNDPARPRYLDDGSHDVPSVALGNAAREALRLADMLQTLLLYGRAGFKRHNPRRLVQARQLERAMDRIEVAIITYLVTLDHDNMTRTDRHLLEGTRTFANNIGHAADVAYSVLGHLGKLRKNGWVLAADQRDELDQTFARLVANQRAAAALFMNSDITQARTLATEKSYFRDLEAHAAERELSRIKLGQVDAADVGALYMDVLRDLKSINSHLVGASAYPLLAQAGELLPSRLREHDA